MYLAERFRLCFFPRNAAVVKIMQRKPVVELCDFLFQPHLRLFKSEHVEARFRKRTNIIRTLPLLSVLLPVRGERTQNFLSNFLLNGIPFWAAAMAPSLRAPPEFLFRLTSICNRLRVRESKNYKLSNTKVRSEHVVVLRWESSKRAYLNPRLYVRLFMRIHQIVLSTCFLLLHSTRLVRSRIGYSSQIYQSVLPEIIWKWWVLMKNGTSESVNNLIKSNHRTR